MTRIEIFLAVAAVAAATWLVRAALWPITRSGKPVRGSAAMRRIIRAARQQPK